ncbi:hypothetical protein [Bradyrhizobium sp. DOA9]|uniref:hypothetical protein n=1 Tax=Bradyrhizobium sp. DOA9 TaxID=1126627 RepID=UPI001FCD9897|nr:hypothetical protein [Bradyrhizobium sp. DOA9]
MGLDSKKDVHLDGPSAGSVSRLEVLEGRRGAACVRKLRELGSSPRVCCPVPLEERVNRWRSMMHKIDSYTIHDWSADYLRELDKSRITVPADQFHHLGLGWTNEARMPLYQDYAAALSAYNEIDPAAGALAYADLKSAFEALAVPLKHTQDRLWDSCSATSFTRHRLHATLAEFDVYHGRYSTTLSFMIMTFDLSRWEFQRSCPKKWCS